MIRSAPYFRLVAALFASALACAVLPAGAQPYPSQPIKIIVPTAPGGVADIVARAFAQKLQESGKTAVVENRTGAAGTIAADSVAKSPPDGYTVYVGFHGTQSILPHLMTLPYDAATDISPVILVARSPNILVVHPSVPAQSMKQLIDYAKANPGKLTYASQGNGSSGHIVGEQFKQVTGTDIAHVPYRGAAPAVQDLVAGHVTMMFDILTLAVPQVKADKVRAIAVAAPQRVAALPDVPTMAEAGLPQLEGGPWFGLLVPAGTPRAVVDWLNSEARKAFEAPEVRERLAAQNLTLPLGTPEDFAAHIAAETKRWGDVIRAANIKME
ncbi:MAG: tripartite tricarboxylate transporter substrate binding protein [Xanthobacteraceae bacterium]